MNPGFVILSASLLFAATKRHLLFALIWIIGSALIGYDYVQVMFGSIEQSYILPLPSIIGSASIGLNPLSAIFGLMFSLGLPLGIVYSYFYHKEHPLPCLRSHLIWLGLMAISMHAILWIRHSLIFLVFWELMSLSSFFCVIANRKQSIGAGLLYIVMMQIGAFFLFAGFGLNYIHTGTFDITELSGLSNWTLALLLIGFAFKAGFFPFYSWLPKAHPVAPAHVSGIMSGLMITTGLYGIVLLLIHNPLGLAAITVLLLISLITAFTGVVHALVENNIKTGLAYSSIENMGLIGLSISMGLLGRHFGFVDMTAICFAGAMLHVLFHSMFKPMLFYLSGNILCATHSIDIDELGGLVKTMPKTAMLFLTGCAAISALPLFNGFISEFGMFYGLFYGINSSHIAVILLSVLTLSLLSFVGALALIAFAKLYSVTFLGNHRSSKASSSKEMPGLMLLPMYIMAGLIVVSGVFGSSTLMLVRPVVQSIGMNSESLTALDTIYRQISVVYGFVIILLASLYLIRKLCVKQRKHHTWGCGYGGGSSKLQYTGHAFISPLSYFLKPFISMDIQDVSPKGDFPVEVCYEERVTDFVNELLIKPAIRLYHRFLAMFDGIHNGKTNGYIAWCLGWLILILMLVLGVLK